MTADDSLQVATIHTLSWQWAYKGIIDQNFLDSLDIQKRAENWKAGVESGNKAIRLVVEYEGEIVGFASGLENRRTAEMPDCDAELWAIYVHPHKVNLGAGNALVTEFKKELKALGKKKFCIWALKDNQQARFFYEKQGGVLSAERTFEIAGQSLPEVGYKFSL